MVAYRRRMLERRQQSGVRLGRGPMARMLQGTGRLGRWGRLGFVPSLLVAFLTFTFLGRRLRGNERSDAPRAIAEMLSQ